eukprot:m51a1_g3211 hypothetical protein (258) ;mRNA; r:31349-32232
MGSGLAKRKRTPVSIVTTYSRNEIGGDGEPRQKATFSPGPQREDAELPPGLVQPPKRNASFVPIFGRPQEGQQDTAYAREIPEEWLKVYSIGIWEVDAQHKKLFEMVEALESLRARPASALPSSLPPLPWPELKGRRTPQSHDYSGAEQVIGGCVDYTRYHFETEEKMMSEAGYANGDHIKEHKHFVEQVLKVVYSVDFGDTKAIDDFVQFLRDWLVSHVLGSDKLFGAWVSAPEQAKQMQKLLDYGVHVTKRPPRT